MILVPTLVRQVSEFEVSLDYKFQDTQNYMVRPYLNNNILLLLLLPWKDQRIILPKKLFNKLKFTLKKMSSIWWKRGAH